MSDPVFRIIDANLNRAREALRVIEEYARFALNDAALAQSAKELRHAVAAIERQAGSDDLLASRDILGDVGRDISTESEYDRSNPADVATASCKRLAEALRAIEEYGKTIDRALATSAETARYQAYELERRIHHVIQARKRFGGVSLYVIITESFCAGDWLQIAESALMGGADCLQLREKDLDDGELLRRASSLAILCRKHDALLIVNDRPDVAVLSGAHGVHLGQTDLSVSQARRILPSHMLVGVSTHSMDQVRDAAASAPDYIAIGPMFPTATKPQSQIAGPRMLTTAHEHTSLPLVAIGGINETNLPAVVGAAPCAVCICTAITSSQDVRLAASTIRAGCGSQHTQ